MPAGRVVIIASNRAPEFEFEGFAHSKGEGAAIGAGSTFSACVSAPGGGCSDAFCAAALVVWFGICGVAGVVGGVAGAATAPSAEEARRAESQFAHATGIRTMQQALRDHVETAALNGGLALVRPPPSPGTSGAPDFGALAATGADSVLETTLLSAGTTGSGINAPVMVYMTARARLLRVGGGKEILSADYTYVGRKLTLAGWSANDAAALLKELESGYDALGGHIFESVFQLYPLPDSSSHPAGILSTAVGLAPIHPPNRGQLTGDIVMGNLFEWTTVDSLRPTLRWQAFPRPSDIAKAPGDMGRVRNVRYDLVIAREENLAPADIVYRGDALASPEQALPISLRPRTRYFWTVRARFELDGRERVTEWASTNYWIREQVTAPSIFSYRFKTP